MNTTVRRFPLVMHRWFKTGAGWAFDVSLDGNVLPIIKGLGSESTARDAGTFKVPYGNGFLLGVRYPDETCEDPRARGRRPTIVVAAVIPHGMPPSEEEELYRLLRKRPCALIDGPAPNLTCELVSGRVNIRRHGNERSGILKRGLSWLLSDGWHRKSSADIDDLITDLERQFADAASGGDRITAERICVPEWWCSEGESDFDLKEAFASGAVLRHVIDVDDPALDIDLRQRGKWITVTCRKSGAENQTIRHLYERRSAMNDACHMVLSIR